MKKLLFLILLFLIPNLVMAEDSKWKRQAKPSEQPTINIEEETSSSVINKVKSKPIKDKKVLTIYSCINPRLEGDENGLKNAMQCNKKCKQNDPKKITDFVYETYLSAEIKPSKHGDAILLRYYKNDGDVMDDLLKSGIDGGGAITRKLTYFDENDWEFTDITGWDGIVILERRVGLRGGQFYDVYKVPNLKRKKFVGNKYITGVCGK